MTHRKFLVRTMVVVLFVLSIVVGSTPKITRAAGTWYVAPSGNDSNACDSPESPCVTINGAIGKASSGDLILVAEGIYTGENDPIVLVNKDIQLTGGWDNSFASQVGLSIIDGENVRRGIQVDAVVSQIEYFRIQNGYADNGGGIANGGDLTLQDCEISSNEAYSYGGGGITNSGNLTLLDSSLEANSGTYGGGILNYGTLAATNTLFKKNYASEGAGLANYAQATLDESQFSQNNSLGIGSGLRSRSGILTVNNSRIDHNTNLSIMNDLDSVLVLNNSAVYANIEGGIRNDGSATINNSTVSGNWSYSSVYPYAGITNSGTFSINNSTITRNHSELGGGINNNSGGSVNLQNTILAGNSAPNGPDCTGSISSIGYNLVGDLSGCVFNASIGDQTDLDPKLSDLLGKPGTAPYHALLPDSPAVDAGNPAGCFGSEGLLDTDQRGANRVGRCDIGAYEYTLPGAASVIYTFAGSPQHTPPGAIFPQNLQSVVLDDLGTPVDLALVTYTAPASGPSGTFADTGTNTTTVESQLDGTATAPTFTANAIRGSYLVTADLPSLGSTDFSLGNFAWYVKTTGNDADDCQSPETACATTNGAMLKPDFIPGEKVFVASGVYTSLEDQVYLLEQSVFLSGGWNDSFTLQEGYSTVDGQNERRGIYITGYNDVLLERFIIQNGLAIPLDGFAQGGGIFNGGRLTLDHCTVKSNTLEGSNEEGAGIYNGNEVHLIQSSIRGNSGNNGSAIYSYYGKVTIDNTIVEKNTSESGSIMGINATLIINRATIRNNKGDGILTFGSTLSVENSLIANNQAIGINTEGELHLSNTVVRDNGGNGINGAYGSSLFLDNCTVANNGPAEDGGGVAGFGMISNCTVSGNQAMNGGGIAGEFTLQNTLVADNIADFGPDITGEYQSYGYNLIENTEGSDFTPIAGDIVGVDPLLGVFESTTGVFPIPPESPAVDGGNPGGCTNSEGVLLETDLRSLPRFGNCDIGSYELQPLGFSTLMANGNEFYPGEPVDFTIFVRNPGQAIYPEVQVSNALPEELEFVEGSLVASRGEANYDAGVISWAGAIADKDEVTIRYSSLVKLDTPTRSVIINTAEISSVEEGYLRSVKINVPPYRLFSSCVNRACLRSVSDDFSDPNSGWPVQDNGKNRYEYLNGEYRILLRPEWGGAGVRSDFYPEDFTARVDVRNATGGQGSYGLLFGLIDNWDSFYTFEIYPEGYFGVYRFSYNDLVILAEGFSPAIKQGTVQNRLGVERSGASIKIYANGQLLGELYDGTYTGYGYIGFIVFSNNQSNLDIYFDNFNAVSPGCLPSATESVTTISRSGMEVPSRRSSPIQK